jgi:hypothetical protein
MPAKMSAWHVCQIEFGLAIGNTGTHWAIFPLRNIPLCPITVICRTDAVRLSILICRFLPQGDH